MKCSRFCKKGLFSWACTRNRKKGVFELVYTRNWKKGCYFSSGPWGPCLQFSVFDHGGGGGVTRRMCYPPVFKHLRIQKWTLNGVLRHIKFAPLNGVTPVKHNLNGVIMGVTYPKWRTLLSSGTQYNTLKWRTLLWYTLQYLKWCTVYMVHSTIP